MEPYRRNVNAALALTASKGKDEKVANDWRSLLDEIVQVQVITDERDVREIVTAQMLNGIEVRCDRCNRAIEIAAALILLDGSGGPFLYCQDCLTISWTKRLSISRSHQVE